MTTELTREPTLQEPATRRLLSNIAPYATIIGMALVVAGIAVARPRFLSGSNLEIVFMDATALVVLAVGLTLVMSMKGIDLSIAAAADLAGYVAAIVLLGGGGVFAAIGVALLIGIVSGFVSGVLSGYLGVPAIVTTLAMNLLLTAVALVVSSNNTPKQLFTASDSLVSDFLEIGSGALGPVKYLIIIAVVCVVITWLVSRRTIWGRQIDLVESSARAASLAGIPVRGTFAAGFVASGLLAAVAGLMLTARTGIAVPGSAEPLLLSAFTAVYIGSVAAPSGRIAVLWTALGAVFVSLLSNGLILLGMGAPWRTGLNGALILLALALATLRRRNKRA